MASRAAPGTRPAQAPPTTAPRQILPGRTYLITRRCLARHFFLRPSALVNQVLAYVLALAAQRYGVQIHAYCVLSNHLHLVLTDPHARLLAFQQFLAAYVARALNAHLGRWEYFWAPGTYSAVALGAPEDIVAKAAYTLANPVAAGLVHAAHLWPGLWSAPDTIGTTIRVKRPDHFFDREGLLPEHVDLELKVPPASGRPRTFATSFGRSSRARSRRPATRSPPSSAWPGFGPRTPSPGRGPASGGPLQLEPGNVRRGCGSEDAPGITPGLAYRVLAWRTYRSRSSRSMSEQSSTVSCRSPRR